MYHLSDTSFRALFTLSSTHVAKPLVPSCINDDAPELTTYLNVIALTPQNRKVRCLLNFDFYRSGEYYQGYAQVTSHWLHVITLDLLINYIYGIIEKSIFLLSCNLTYYDI